MFAIPLAILYGMYRAIRWLVVGNSLNSTSADPAENADPTVRKLSFWRRRREKPVVAWVAKPPRERFTELLGSLLASSLISGIVCGLAVFIYSHDHARLQPEQAAWLMLASMTGAWAILIAAKSWEGVDGDSASRRFFLMVIGLGVGMLACLSAEWLMVNLPESSVFPHFRMNPFRHAVSFYAADGHPLMAAFAVGFGTLFLLVRWWRQTDPRRAARISLRSLIVSMIAAYIAAELWHFPQPWLPVTAGIISLSVQLASPWVNPKQRSGQEDA
jgi:hypothetical protein